MHDSNKDFLLLFFQSQPIGTDIFTATATDADSGSNGRVTYSFVSSPVRDVSHLERQKYEVVLYSISD